MIKFRGKLLNGLNVELPLIEDCGPDAKIICTFVKENVTALAIKEDSIKINVSGHWLKVEDLEAIVEKVMGGKGE